MFKSKNFYVKVRGDLALFTAPPTKGGSERFSYLVPTQQALHGIVDAIYFKPTFTNIVSEVKVINRIQTEIMGMRNLYLDGAIDRSNISYLSNVEYLIKFYFTWNDSRMDLKNDRNISKHESIMERSLKKGGRRDIFLGSRECLGFAEEIDEDEYENSKSFYQGQELDFGLMFQTFSYPTKQLPEFWSYYSKILMKDGVITFKDIKDCEVRNKLSNTEYTIANQIKSVDNEYNEIQSWEE